MDNAYHTWQEIESQPAVWGVALSQLGAWSPALLDFYRRGHFESLLFTGCGSSYYLALSAALLFTQQCAKAGRALPASEVWLGAETAFAGQGKTLLVAFSRSGETSETLNACQIFLEKGYGDLLTLTCYPHSELSSLGTLNLTFPASGEESFAQTRSLSTLCLAATWLATLWAERDDLLVQMEALPGLAARLMAGYADLVKSLANDPRLERFYFLGSGSRYGLASELSLKMKEMSLSHSEPFHFMEFRHGPMAMAGPGALITGLVSEAHFDKEMAVLKEMQDLGAQTLAIGEIDVQAAFKSGIDESLRGPLYLPLGQMLAFQRAVKLGLNPDRPRQLQAVIRLERSPGGQR